MSIRRPIIHRCCAALCALTLSGCYSATQTPVIGAKEVSREVAADTPEMRLLAPIAPQPPSQWRPGKQWLVTDDKLRMLLRGLTPGTGLEGARLTYVATRSVPSVTGDQDTELTFTIGSDTVAYRIGATPAETAARRQLTIPFTIDLDLVSEVGAVLKGRELYTMTSSWLDSAGNYTTGRRYVPVRVTDVVPGIPQAPVSVVISPAFAPGEQFSLLMTLSERRNGVRDFPSLFSLSDPRSRHTDIYPDIWELITRGEVRDGMTREECRLALGAPTEIKRRELYGLTREIWSYSNGTYLRFDDGILQSHHL